MVGVGVESSNLSKARPVGVGPAGRPIEEARVDRLTAKRQLAGDLLLGTSLRQVLRALLPCKWALRRRASQQQRARISPHC